MNTLVGRPGEPLPVAARPPSLVVLRASLLVADVALAGGAVLYAQLQPSLNWTTTAVALLAAGLGAWLGWLGLTWGRE